MPPTLALVLTIGFILWLLVRDSQKSETTAALWIPLLWICISSSRYVSAWLSLTPTLETPDDFLAGSPVDRAVFLALILAAIVVVSSRHISWQRLAVANAWLLLYLAYGCLSVVWSDYPFVAFKRWIKGLGHPLMALVILSEPNPTQAIATLFRRYAYVLVPLSVLFIKYYPELGRGFSPWTGEAYNTGVTTNKNALGILCLIAGYCLFWNLFVRLGGEVKRFRNADAWGALIVLAMTMWLLRMANSATSLVAFVVGISVTMLLGTRFLSDKRLTVSVVLAGLIGLTAELLLNVSTYALEVLGRDPTLTDRTELWADLLSIPINPMLGAGFESFWLGERAAKLWSKWTWRPNQAHNGYLETYLNAGWVGVSCLTALIVATYYKAKRLLVSSPADGRFRLGFLAILLVYNYTEAAFKAMHPLFFVMYLVSFDVHALQPITANPRFLAKRQWPGTPNEQRRRQPVEASRRPRDNSSTHGRPVSPWAAGAGGRSQSRRWPRAGRFARTH